jgi:hypothetical protein
VAKLLPLGFELPGLPEPNTKSLPKGFDGDGSVLGLRGHDESLPPAGRDGGGVGLEKSPELDQ